MPVVGEERVFHFVYFLMQGFLGTGEVGPLFVFRVFILVFNGFVPFFIAVEVAPGMVFRSVVGVVAAVYLHMVVAGEVASVGSRVVEVESVLAFRDAFAKAIDAIVGAVEDDFA